MVSEILAALQMSFFFVTAPAIVLLLQLERDVMSRSDEHCKVGSPWSCDKHHISMIFEDRTRQEVLVDILTVLGALVF